MTGTTFTHNNKEYIVTEFVPMSGIDHILGTAAAKLNRPKATALKAFMVKKSYKGNIYFDYISGVKL
jgi:hypothetical protein